MMHSKLSKVFMMVFLLLFVSTIPCIAVEPPPKIISALIVQMIPFEKNLMAGEGEMSIHVVGSTALADALKDVVGWQIGKRILGKVTVSDSLPAEKPDIICITDKSNLKEILAYSHQENIMTITNNPKWVRKGITLGIDVDSKGKPKMKLSLKSSKEENLNWNPAVFKIVKTTKR